VSPLVAKLFVVAALVAGLAGCSADSPSEPTDSSAPTTTSVLAAPDIRQRAVELADGTTRDYGAYVPPSVAASPAAVVVLHAIGDETSAEASWPNTIVAAANDFGFVTVVPTGVDFTWNAGTCCGTAVAEGIDDVGYLRAVIVDIAANLDVDPDRIFVVGLSNGGMMAYRLGCEIPELLAGIAVVEGVLVFEPCRPESPLDLIQIHQMGDDIVPYRGTTLPIAANGELPAVKERFTRWTVAQGCSATGVRDGEFATYDFECRNGTRAREILIPGGTHDWPIAPQDPVDATTAILEFFGISEGQS
jgi:polyhydroxybutyrate depolymerase